MKDKVITPPLPPYEKWWDDVCVLVENNMNCDRSDAQGVLMAQDDLVQQCWHAGLLADQTAKMLDSI